MFVPFTMNQHLLTKLIVHLLFYDVKFLSSNLYLIIDLQPNYNGELYFLCRLMPTLGALILFCTFVMPILGSGPQWNLVVRHHAEVCKTSWWRNLLFIHNYFGFKNMVNADIYVLIGNFLLMSQMNNQIFINKMDHQQLSLFCLMQNNFDNILRTILLFSIFKLFQTTCLWWCGLYLINYIEVINSCSILWTPETK